MGNNSFCKCVGESKQHNYACDSGIMDALTCYNANFGRCKWTGTNSTSQDPCIREWKHAIKEDEDRIKNRRAEPSSQPGGQYYIPPPSAPVR